jgi:phosphoribosylglycinamide formyltransferase 1
MRLAVFASGGGSNFGAILDAIAAGTLPAQVVLLVTDRPACGAQGRAEAAGVPVAVLPPRDYGDEGAFGAALLAALTGAAAEAVVLAGYLKKVPPAVVAAFDGRLVNVHPALLPDFGGPGLYGRRVHEAVLAAGAKESGCTVHLVDDEYDGGPILAQVRVPVLPGDTPETLAARVLTEEHRLLPAVLASLVRDGWGRDG